MMMRKSILISVSLLLCLSIVPLASAWFPNGTADGYTKLLLHFDNDTAPTGTVKYKDSSSINYNNGNPWKEIVTWSMTLQ